MKSLLKPRWMVLALFVATGVAVWLLAREHLSLERLAEQDRQLRSAIDAQPWLAFAIGFGIYTVVSLFPGTSGKSIVCGWLFGFWQSLVMVTVALTLAGLAGFSVARYVLRDTLHRRFGKRLARLERLLEKQGPFYLLTVRMLHVPFTLVNYTAGASQISARTFAWTTLLGLVPSTMIFVGVGANLPALDELVENGAERLLSPPLLFALLAMGVAPLAIRGAIRTLVRKLRPSDEEAAFGGVERGAEPEASS